MSDILVEFHLNEYNEALRNLVDGFKSEIILENNNYICETRDDLESNRKTGIVFHESMAEHRCLWDPNFPENPQRFNSIVKRINELRLTDECFRVNARMATVDEILAVHSKEYFEEIENTVYFKTEQLKIASGKYDSVYFHPKAYEASMYAAGCSIELVKSIVTNEVKNGFAIVRPPGHHASPNEACGYCIFNNVAVAASFATEKLGVERILIVDWDVHHGQGTQEIFYNRSDVLYFSVHRHEFGTFWPNLKESNFDHIGEGNGKGFNVNVPLNTKGLTGSEYLAIWHHLLLPIAYEFDPQLVIISAGFDAAIGCPKGEMLLSPSVFSHLCHSLMGLAKGKVAVVLEGGYCLSSLAESAAFTLRTLLGYPCPKLENLQFPIHSLVVKTISDCIETLQPYWKSLKLNVKNVHPKPIKAKSSRSMRDGFAMCNPSKMKPTYLAFTLSTDEHQNVIIHPERPERVSFVYEQLKLDGLVEKCVLQEKKRYATEEELLLVHSKKLIDAMIASETMGVEQMVPPGMLHTYIRKSTNKTAKLAAGCLLDVVDSVLTNKCANGFAVIRPPGHHANAISPAGFCIYNNVAIAAKYAVDKYGLQKVLIVDWDVHYGDGVQSIFEDKPNVYYISLHNFLEYPMTNAGNIECKKNIVNIPWKHKTLYDSDYLMAFFKIILPIAYEINPDLILVACGFDAAENDLLSFSKLTPKLYGHLVHLLQPLAEGKVIVALEGGYNLKSVARGSSYCLSALLNDSSQRLSLNETASETVETINEVMNYQSSRWNSLII